MTHAGYGDPDYSEIRMLFGRDCPDLGGSTVINYLQVL